MTSRNNSFTDEKIKQMKANPGPGSHELDPFDRMKFRSMSVHKFSKSKLSYEINPHKSTEHLSPFTYNSKDFLQKSKGP